MRSLSFSPSSDPLQKAAEGLTSALMSQLVTHLFKTIEKPLQQELFMSFLSEKVGEQMAHAGMANTMTTSLKEQLVRFQEKQGKGASYEQAAQRYEQTSLLTHEGKIHDE